MAMIPCLAVFALVVGLAPWVGSSAITMRGVITGAYPDREIFVIARLPRIIFGALAGGALAVSGVLFQALLRNSLATPFTLGVSAGSSFGAVVAIALGLNVVILGAPAVSIFAFIGAFLTIGLVFYVARSRGTLPTISLLLAGVTLNFVFGALTLFLHYASDFAQAYMITRWMMGSLDGVDYASIWRTAPFVLAGVLLVIVIAPKLNVLSAGEDWATSRGVDVRRLKTHCYVAGSILTGAVTAFSGPIGFVGLVVPHALRMLLGPDHRVLVPASFFVGGAFLVVCDTAARTLLSPTEIPVGAITALIGGPFFIGILKRKQDQLW